MPTAPNDSDLAAILPGTWNVRSTNSPLWLDSEHTSPRFTFTLQRESPLTLREDVSYLTAEGTEKHVFGVDKWGHDEFVRHGKGLRSLRRGRWSIVGANDASTVIAIRSHRTLVRHAGLEILVREGVDVAELRSLVARNTEQFGLSAEDFASLTWFDAPASAPSTGDAKPTTAGDAQKAE
jgi:hypothetical protein